MEPYSRLSDGCNRHDEPVVRVDHAVFSIGDPPVIHVALAHIVRLDWRETADCVPFRKRHELLFTVLLVIMVGLLLVCGGILLVWLFYPRGAWEGYSVVFELALLSLGLCLGAAFRKLPLYHVVVWLTGGERLEIQGKFRGPLQGLMNDLLAATRGTLTAAATHRCGYNAPDGTQKRMAFWNRRLNWLQQHLRSSAWG